MFKGRRVGTFTLGMVLVAFGALFLVRLYVPAISFSFILALWPLILIFLGVEVLVAYFVNNEEKLKYDGGAVALLVILSFFSVAMACAEFLVNHAGQFRIYT
ncbi:MAG: DUF5668 domain-containing protein [Clostridia bacterium]|nr:DUF5668 domain-containing protein [Clostridia bacterium]MDR3644131.1 DUF5668 domain-containing protein [Clostridia bacterium]